MKKLLSFLIVALALMPLLSKAQSTTTNGPELEMNDRAITCVLEDNDDYMRFYSMEVDLWMGYNDIEIYKYDKHTRKITVQEVDEDYEGRIAFLNDDKTSVTIVRCAVNKKTQMMEYQKVSFPLDAKVPKKLVFTTIYSFPVEKKNETYQTCAVFNEDKSKFAIVSMPFPDNKQSEKRVDVAVFDNSANLLFHDSKVTSCYRGFQVDNISLTLDGTVYVANSNSIYDRIMASAVRIFVCSEHGFFDYIENLDENIYYTFKQSLNSEGGLSLVGIRNKEGNPECNIRTYTVTPDGAVDFVDQDITLSEDYEGIKYNDGSFAKEEGYFYPHIFDMIKLHNGNFLFVGEMRKRVAVGSTGEYGQFSIYGFLSHNMFYAIVTPDGNVQEMHIYPRMTVTSEDSGRWRESNPVYAFEWDGDAYLVYNDHRGNYKGNGSVHCLFYNRPDQCSVVLSKIEENGELSSTILFNATTTLKDPRYIANQHNHEYFNRLMYSAEDGVYYILRNDGEYRLEKITFE